MNVNYISPLREQQGLTQTELGEKVGVTRQTIAVWERGERFPSFGQISRIADALHVPVDLLIKPPNDSETPALLFRADDSTALTAALKAQVQLKVEDYVGLEEDLNETPALPPAWPLDHYDEIKAEWIARELRDFLGVEEAPLGDVIDLLEDKGFKVIITPLPESVSGFSAYTEQWGGVIVVNAKHPVERQYFTALHELTHLVCHRKDYQSGNVPGVRDPREKIANHVAGAILLSRETMERELRGYQQQWLPEPLLITIKRRYSVSMRTVLIRAKDLGMISARQCGQQLGKLNKVHGRDKEPAQLQRHHDLYKFNEEKKGGEDKVGVARTRLERLVYEAASKEMITRSRAAEILDMPMMQLRRNLGAWLSDDGATD